MNIPPRPPKGSPPRRAALHERSDSHTNERASPTLRVIGDPQAQVHTSSPFPTKPSHILSPKVYDGQPSTSGSAFGASNDGGKQSEAENGTQGPLSAATSSSQRQGGSADGKDAIHIPTQGTIPGPDMSTGFLKIDEGMDNDTNRTSDEIVQLPSSSPGSPGSELYSTADRGDRQPVSKDSDGSLSSSNSTGTVIVRRNRDGPKRASYSAFPNTARPGSSKSSLSLSTLQRPVTSDTGGSDAPVSPISPSSPVSPDYTVHQERRIPSIPFYANLHAPSQNSVNLQYPVIRPPSVSASWYVNSENEFRNCRFLWLVLMSFFCKNIFSGP